MYSLNGENYHLKEEIKKNLSNVLKDNGLLVILTAPGEAPLLRVSKVEKWKNRILVERDTVICL